MRSSSKSDSDHVVKRQHISGVVVKEFRGYKGANNIPYKAYRIRTPEGKMHLAVVEGHNYDPLNKGDRVRITLGRPNFYKTKQVCNRGKCTEQTVETGYQLLEYRVL